MKFINSIRALWLMVFSTKIFRPEDIFRGKRVAVIGAADSAFEHQNGKYIDSFDLIVRVNKAPHSWTREKAKFIGSRTDVLFHSFYENSESGGGVIDLKLYNSQGIKYIVNPNNNLNGLRTHFNYYKRNLNYKITYLLPRWIFKKMTVEFDAIVPTVGYSALYTVMNSNCKEIFITGFTFFKTPYANDYRDHLMDMAVNENHLKKQGLHDPELEFKEFLREFEKNKLEGTPIVLDEMLSKIINIEKLNHGNQ
jgi:hypothetical protein